MERQSYETGDQELKLNMFTNNTFINIVAKSGKIGTASKANHI
jgi:hypothetical protein